MGLKIIGHDDDCITRISIDALDTLTYKTLLEIWITSNPKAVGQFFCFIFDDDTEYIASGFSTGYSGEGPRGLYKAIKMFWPDYKDKDFQSSGIALLAINESHVIVHDGVLNSEKYSFKQ